MVAADADTISWRGSEEALIRQDSLAGLNSGRPWFCHLSRPCGFYSFQINTVAQAMASNALIHSPHPGWLGHPLRQGAHWFITSISPVLEKKKMLKHTRFLYVVPVGSHFHKSFVYFMTNDKLSHSRPLLLAFLTAWNTFSPEGCFLFDSPASAWIPSQRGVWTTLSSVTRLPPSHVLVLSSSKGLSLAEILLCIFCLSVWAPGGPCWVGAHCCIPRTKHCGYWTGFGWEGNFP